MLTPTLPERSGMLEEAKASVRAQTFGDVEHLIAVDPDRRGAGPLLNIMLGEVLSEWVMVLDDDDLLDPNHLATLHEHIDGADVVYSMPRVEGGTFTLYDAPFDREALAQRNIVSHNALMRTQAVRAIGGWCALRHFDWDLFRRLDAVGARFRKVDAVTWTYRLHGSNWSQGTLAGSP